MTDMQEETMQRCCKRYRSALPFLALGTAAILVGGVIAAAVAHNPGRDVVWMVAYLVLVVGLAQIILGIGQIVLADKLVPGILVAAQFLLFNIGNAGVIAGTVADTFPPVAVGTVLVLIGLGLFLYGSRGSAHGRLRNGYRSLIGLIAIGALVGLVLSALTNLG